MRLAESQDHMKDLSIVNVVGGGSTCRELDLLQVSQDFPHSEVEYNPDSFVAVVIRYSSPKGTIMLYASGKYSLAGAKSVSEAREVNEMFIQQLEQLLGEDLVDREFEIRYLVGTADTGTALDLNRVSVLLGIDKIEYEPEQFPGLFYRPSGQDWFCILFSSGKAVFSGAHDKEEFKKISSEVGEKIDELF